MLFSFSTFLLPVFEYLYPEPMTEREKTLQKKIGKIKKLIIKIFNIFIFILCVINIKYSLKVISVYESTRTENYAKNKYKTYKAMDVYYEAQATFAVFLGDIIFDDSINYEPGKDLERGGYYYVYLLISVVLSIGINILIISYQDDYNFINYLNFFKILWFALQPFMLYYLWKNFGISKGKINHFLLGMVILGVAISTVVNSCYNIFLYDTQLFKI